MTQPHHVRSAALAALLLVAIVAPAAEAPLAPAFGRPAPESVSELRAIEKAAREMADRVLPCTVGVEVGMAMGSGVIVSADGYVLTAAHVAGRPGQEVRIILEDGTKLAGRTLGLHTVADGALIKISSQGEWPFAPLVSPDEAPQIGDWCLATGHPGGIQLERGAPIRLGRVVEIFKSVIRTDCPITEGDSGGPLFDMQGRVIGIHSRITQDVTENFHGPGLAFREAWDTMKAGKIYPVRPASRFLDLLDVDRDGRLTREELPEGTRRRVYDRLAAELQLDADEPHSVEAVAEKVLRWRRSTFLDLDTWDHDEDDVSVTLSPSHFVRGRNVRRSFAEIAADVSEGTVRIRSDGQWVALGAVVSSDGLVLTKASELGDDVRCGLSDGREIAADLVDVDDSNDLALLRMEADGLTPVNWLEADLPAGSWLVTPGAEGRTASVGVVSTGPRKVSRIPAVMGVEIDVQSRRPLVRQVIPRGGAAEAGIEGGDVITRIADVDISSFEDLQNALTRFRAGDVITATILRGAELLELDVTLGAQEEVFFRFGINRMNGSLSRRRDDFPRVVQHDSALDPALCGGPVVDSNGSAVGINIARADRVSAYLIPYEEFAAFIHKHHRE